MLVGWYLGGAALPPAASIFFLQEWCMVQRAAYGAVRVVQCVWCMQRSRLPYNKVVVVSRRNCHNQVPIQSGSFVCVRSEGHQRLICHPSAHLPSNAHCTALHCALDTALHCSTLLLYCLITYSTYSAHPTFSTTSLIRVNLFGDSRDTALHT